MSTVKQRFLKGAAWLAGGTVAGQAAVVLVSPFVSRLYGKEDFAVLGTFAAILTWLAPIACLRYDSVVSVPKDESEARALVRLCLWCTLATVLATSVVLVPAAGTVARMLGNPGAKLTIWLIPLSLAGIGVYQALAAWSVRNKLFRLNAQARLSQGVGQAAVQVGGGIVSAGPWGLVTADIAGRVLGAVGMAVALTRSGGLSKAETANMGDLAKRFSQFPVFGVPAALLHTGFTNLPLVTSALYGPAAWGLVFFGARVVWAPVSVLGQALAQVYVAESSIWAQERSPAMLRAFDSLVKRLALLGLTTFGLLAALAQPVVPIVFGDKWASAVPLLQAQVLGWFVQFVVGPVLPTLNVLKLQRTQLMLDAGGLAAAGALMGYSWWSGQGPIGLMWSYSLATALLYGGFLLACRRAIVRHLAEQVSHQAE